MFKRMLQIELPPGQSAFLWGPRKSGKTMYLHQRFPDSTRYDFLQTDTFFRLSRNPELLRQELTALSEAGRLRQPVILDEIQKVPALLDEVHWLIENRRFQFILCGSSARKLKRGHGNLLGGRAWRYEMLPLTSQEIPDFNLLRALNHGLIPSHYLAVDAHRTLKAYIQDYLKEEILAEGLTRNMPAFSRFMDALAFSQGELTNYANIARDCGVDAKTVKGYFEILADTHLGVFLDPFTKRGKREIITSTPKFYLFDVGTAGFLARRKLMDTRGSEFGRAFEHFILMELLAHRSYRDLDHSIRFWRTKTGYEVDFVLGDGDVAIEVKGVSRLDGADLKPMRAFQELYRPRKGILVCNEHCARLVDGIHILPWQDFLQALWNDKVV